MPLSLSIHVRREEEKSLKFSSSRVLKIAWGTSCLNHSRHIPLTAVGFECGHYLSDMVVGSEESVISAALFWLCNLSLCGPFLENRQTFQHI